MSDQASIAAPSQWKYLVRYLGIGVTIISILGAIPTAINVYHGWKQDIPWWEVPERLKQVKMFETNFGCTVKYYSLSVATNTDVQVGSCGSTRDISLKVSAAGYDDVYEWIPFKSLRKPGESLSFMDSLFPPAGAAQPTPSSPSLSSPSLSSRGLGTMLRSLRLAQATGTKMTSKVMCEKREGYNIVRVIKETAANKCFRETFSVFKGRVEKREEIPCKDACPKPAKT